MCKNGRSTNKYVCFSYVVDLELRSGWSMSLVYGKGMENRRDGQSADLPQAPPQSRATTQSASAPAQNSFQIRAPSISLPKGGGAIRGIGEKFAANPVTGTGSMSVPIATSPSRGGFGPQLSMSYDSGAGNGRFGLGWNLSLPSITRKTDKGFPRYRDHESRTCLSSLGRKTSSRC